MFVFMDEFVKYLKALVYLQAVQLNQENLSVKKELILANAGLSYKEISEIVGKSETGIAKAVSRARIAQKGKKENE